MKISFYFKSILSALVLLLVVGSCKKDEESFHQISAIETQIYYRMNDFRESKGLNTLVMQPIMFEEARIHSDQMAGGDIPVGGDGIDDRFAAIKEKIGGTSQGWIVLESPYNNADTIVKYITSDSSSVQIITQTYTQAGVGVSYDENGNAYVTQLFLNIPDKK